MSNLHTFKTPQALVAELSEAIANDLADAIMSRGNATLLVSGGSTPKALFEALSIIDLGWEKVHVSVVDERWVDAAHKDSNAKLVKEHLLQNCAAKATFIPLYREGLTPQMAEKKCNRYLESLTPFDVAVLGMGADAHTASLFPHNERLEEAYKTHDFCIAITPENAPHERMSLTLAALLHVTHCYLHIEGEIKKAVFDKALSTHDPIAMPISALLHHEQCALEVYYA